MSFHGLFLSGRLPSRARLRFAGRTGNATSHHPGNSTGIREFGLGGRRLALGMEACNRYLRRLLTLGATSVVHYARRKPERATWINGLLARRPTRVVITAVANKLARIIWAVLSRGENFRRPEAAAA
jgi:hypothetical protein